LAFEALSISVGKETIREQDDGDDDGETEREN